MERINYLKNIVKLQKQGIAIGVCSICSSNPFVIETALEHALGSDRFVLIESTCNQVNQFGGYTGMTPYSFINFVYSIAESIHFPKEKIIFGGDHLGPNPWKNENADTSLKKALELIKEYVLAGFTKIHIDCSMRLKNDAGNKNSPLDPYIIAERTAFLCSYAEELIANKKYKPVYVIGTDVPSPGGIKNDSKKIYITKASDFYQTMNFSKEAFYKKNLFSAWERVIAVVVNTGVEYGNQIVYEYERERNKDLCEALKNFPNIVFEGHSTDYQQGTHLKQMVEDGIAILKVGPALTFAMREGLFLLKYIEDELFKGNNDFELSNLINVIDEAMIKNPAHWESYYKGNEQEIKFARKYSLYDRIRYYWTETSVQQSVKKLIKNLESCQIPLSLLSQFFHGSYLKARDRNFKITPMNLIKDKIKEILLDYQVFC
ncbi:MAG: class II D-tagatose-bisphosphate aldolase, non-catalytic subunit [Desulfobacterales bacterium]|nr:class II D-tagatose-bisphosphate aldolase, non-catalytic subunit [Desulfobacterales bacterium]